MLKVAGPSCRFLLASSVERLVLELEKRAPRQQAARSSSRGRLAPAVRGLDVKRGDGRREGTLEKGGTRRVWELRGAAEGSVDVALRLDAAIALLLIQRGDRLVGLHARIASA